MNYVQLQKAMPPNQSPEPTAVDVVRSAVAVHVASRRWLTSLRCSHSFMVATSDGVWGCLEGLAEGAKMGRGSKSQTPVFTKEKPRFPMKPRL